MDLTLAKALRLQPGLAETSWAFTVAFAGAGGKTTAMFSLARELRPPVLLTATTHMGAWQTALADQHLVALSPQSLEDVDNMPITLITGRIGPDERAEGVNPEVLIALRELSAKRGWPLLIEADGSRQKPLKAPGADEPPIPMFADLVVVMAGIGALGKPLSRDTVHHPDLFSGLSGLDEGTTITDAALARVLVHPLGGLKNIPSRARRVAVLNQADTTALQSAGQSIARAILPAFDSAVVASLQQEAVYAANEPSAGIVLAAGAATRFGEAKQLLQWEGEPLVRAAARIALQAGLSPVVVVTGAEAARVESALEGLQTVIVRNEGWQEGQASSIRRGIASLPQSTGAAVFMLADQPHVTVEVVRALTALYAARLDPIVAPLVQGERRGNPVLFDRSTFADLQSLAGDTGGRAIFSKHHVEYLPWHDEALLVDIDTPEDYRNLLRGPGR
jgi:molybdenum cofactor cytidylyltransferase